MGKKRKQGGFGLSKEALAKAKSRSRAEGRQAAKKVQREGLRARDTEKSFPPVFVGWDGVPLKDPWATLGLAHGEPFDAASVEAAFQKAVRVTTPEKDPEGARALMEARRFLLDPENALLREVGDLRVPNPEAFLDDYQITDAVRDLVDGKEGTEQARADGAAEPSLAPPPVDWPSHSRIATLMTLMALVEAEINGDLT